jgi:hypothetical protein
MNEAHGQVSWSVRGRYKVYHFRVATALLLRPNKYESQLSIQELSARTWEDALLDLIWEYGRTRHNREEPGMLGYGRRDNDG